MIYNIIYNIQCKHKICRPGQIFYQYLPSPTVSTFIAESFIYSLKECSGKASGRRFPIGLKVRQWWIHVARPAGSCVVCPCYMLRFMWATGDSRRDSHCKMTFGIVVYSTTYFMDIYAFCKTWLSLNCPYFMQSICKIVAFKTCWNVFIYWFCNSLLLFF